MVGKNLLTSVRKLKLKELLQTIPGVLWIYQTLKSGYWLLKTDSFRFIKWPIPAGHFYSPIPDSKGVLARAQVLFDQGVDRCPGIELREKAQLELLEVFSRYYDALPWSEVPANSTRYHLGISGFFKHGDAIALYSFLRHYEPRKVVEVGSGFSSAAMLDTNDLFLEKAVDFTFVEPYPDRLFRLLRREDKPTILRKQVQDTPLEVFSDLSENDILFVDSSHVVKIGSDVKDILFRILPALKPGVLIHFHDIFWPFEYPKEYLLKGAAFNEAYFLRSFLQFNEAFEIMLFNSYLATHHGDALQKMPLFSKNPGSSVWLRKVA
jgi:predicted O-methyltransferase YrrM